MTARAEESNEHYWNQLKTLNLIVALGHIHHLDERLDKISCEKNFALATYLRIGSC